MDHHRTVGHVVSIIALALLACASFSPRAVAQQDTPTYSYVGTPSGSCTGVRTVIAATTGVAYYCNGGTWAAASATGGSPAGSNTYVQYNNAGAFGGAAALTYDSGNASVGVTKIRNSVANSGTNSVLKIGNTVALGGTTELLTLYSDDLTTKRAHFSGANGALIFDTAGSQTVIQANDGANPSSIQLGSSILTGNYNSNSIYQWYSANAFKATNGSGVDNFIVTTPGGRVTLNGAGGSAWISTDGTSINHGLQVAAPAFIGNASTATSATTATALSTAGAANQFWKNGNVWGQPSFGDLSGTAFLSQIQTGTGVLKGSGGSPAYSSIIDSDLSGFISVAHGGTGTSTAPTLHGVVVGGTGSTYSSLGVGASGTVLTGVSGSDPTWAAVGPPTYSGLTQYGLIWATTTTTASQSTLAGSTTQVLHGNGLGAPTWSSVDLSTDTAATVLPMTKGGNGASITGVAGGVHYSNSSTTTTQTTGGAQGSVLYNSGANTPAWLSVGAAGTVLHGGATVPSYSAVDLSADTAATALPIAKGGTNATSQTQWGAAYYDGTKIATTASGASGYVLTAQGTAAPVWLAAPAPSFTGLTTGGSMWANSATSVASSAAGTAGQKLTSNGTSAPTWRESTTRVYLTSNISTTSTSGATAFTLTADRGTYMSVQCELLITASVTTMNAQINAAGSCTTPSSCYTSSLLGILTSDAQGVVTTASYMQQRAVATSYIGPTTSSSGAASYPMIWHLTSVVDSADLLTFSVAYKASSAGTITIWKGSWCEY